MKTILQHFNDRLPEDIRKLAIENAPEDRLETGALTVQHAILIAFDWERTEQGYAFWHKQFSKSYNQPTHETNH